MTSRASRSKFAVDLMYRLFDEVQSRWIIYQGRSIWGTRTTPERVKDKMVQEGRDPSTLNVERVFVEVK